MNGDRQKCPLIMRWRPMHSTRKFEGQKPFLAPDQANTLLSTPGCRLQNKNYIRTLSSNYFIDRIFDHNILENSFGIDSVKNSHIEILQIFDPN
jgi:hypothetical protein